MVEGDKIKWFIHPDLIPEDPSREMIGEISRAENVISPIAVLPDFHYKRGAEVPIGIAVATNNTIIPGLIGVPNCGIAMLTTDLSVNDLTSEQIDTIFRKLAEEVPGRPWRKPQLSQEDMIKAVRGGAAWAIEKFKLPQYWLERIEKSGNFLATHISSDEVKDIIPPTAINWGRYCLGVLGGGNHFLELHYIDRIENQALAGELNLKEKQLVFILHTDSLKMGSQTHLHYSARGELKRKPFKYLAMLLMQLWWHFLRDLSFKSWLLRWRTYIVRKGFGNLPADGVEGRRFLDAFSLAGNFGFVNRLAIMSKIINTCEDVAKRKIKTDLLFDPAHDMVTKENIDSREFILHRNGTNVALPKDQWRKAPFNVTGQPILIPGALGTESYIGCADEGVKNTYWTTNHGVGRMLDKHMGEANISEGEAHKILEGQRIKLYRSGKGRISGQISSNFKSLDKVIQVMKEHRLMRLVARMKPIASLKG